ncbi:unnamed protein product [Aspergillus oryzae]|uniref:Unnamed protein product n=1 Tax=Aspergillus oryzae TaxID=5062 RepID=A0AAN4YHH4_ASPOZ|nr:unnamed protein product [Aspergillus oryzae]
MKAYRYALYRRTRRLRLALFFVLVGWTLVEVLRIKYTLVQQSQPELVALGSEKIYITGLHWNSELILRDAWIAAVVDLANTIGRDSVFVSIQESGSWDDTKGALILLDQLLAENDIPRRILIDYTTHFDEISKPPTGQGWIETPIGTTELRRIPYLAKLRNVAMEPLYELQNEGIVPPMSNGYSPQREATTPQHAHSISPSPQISTTPSLSAMQKAMTCSCNRGPTSDLGHLVKP